jgi:hypothetical protein
MKIRTGWTMPSKIWRKALIAACLAAVLNVPAPAQEARTWIFDDNAETATLQYGTPESDDVVIAFSCEANSKMMRIAEFLASSSLTPGRTARLRLARGNVSLEYTGQALANETDGDVYLEVVTAADRKLFALLKAGPSLTIDIAGTQTTIPLTNATPHVAALERFCLGQR